MAFILALGAVLTCFSCKAPTAPPADSDSNTQNTESGFETTPPEPDLPFWEEYPGIMIAENGKIKFKVIRPQAPANEEKNVLSGVLEFLRANGTADISTGDDWVNDKLGYSEGEYEILIGKTNRKETKEVLDNLRKKDYAVAIVGKKIVITAHDNNLLTKAMKCFLDALYVKDGRIFLAEKDTRYLKSSYDVEAVTLNGKELSEFKLVYRDGADDAVRNAVTELKYDISDLFGYTLGIATDSTEVTGPEIVFGSTSRGESELKCKLLPANDCRISMSDSTVYLCRGNGGEDYSKLTYMFLKKLADNVADGKIELSSEEMYEEYNAKYPSPYFHLNGNPIQSYTIVYPDGNTRLMNAAERLRDYITYYCGRCLDVKKESAKVEGLKILIGTGDGADESFKSGEYILKKLDGALAVGGKRGDHIAAGAAVNKLLQLIAKCDTSVTADMAKSENAVLSEYKIMTYNDGDNSTTNTSQVGAILKEYGADIISIQEIQEKHIEIYEKILGGYDTVYFDNDGDYGCPIMYKTDKFELLESGVQWLSDTPNVKFSSYSDSDYVRSYIYAIFKDKTTEAEFVMISTHLDYVDSANRKQVAKLLELTRKFGDRPIIMAADWNMNDTQKGYSTMLESGFLPTYASVKDAEKPGTMVGSEYTIDFIFCDRVFFNASEYKVVNDHIYSDTASDHYAVYSKITMITAE